MDKEEVGDKTPLRERDLNLGLSVAQEERHWTNVAMDPLLLPNQHQFSALVIGSLGLVLSRKKEMLSKTVILSFF